MPRSQRLLRLPGTSSKAARVPSTAAPMPVYHARRNGDGLFLRVGSRTGHPQSHESDRCARIPAASRRPWSACIADRWHPQTENLVRRFEQGPDAFLVRAEGQVHGEVFAPIEVGRERGDSGFQELGRALAQLHEASLTFAQTVDFDQHSWRRELAAIAPLPAGRRRSRRE